MNTAPIRNVVFDIGWVFVRLKYRPLLELLRSRGVEADDLHSVLARAALEDHESGRLPGPDPRTAGGAHPRPGVAGRALRALDRHVRAGARDGGARPPPERDPSRLPAVEHRRSALGTPVARVPLPPHRARRAALVPRRRDEAARRHLRRGGAALCARAGRDRVRRRPRRQHSRRARPWLAWHRPRRL